MTRTLHLISHDLCPYVQRAVIALEEKNIAYRRTDIDLADKPAWFLALSPLGKVPVLAVDGTAIFESAVIVEFLEETTPVPLHPRDPVERARQRSWIEVASRILDLIAGLYNAPDAAAFAEKRAALAAMFDRVESALDADGRYFAGPAFGLVDAAFAPALRYFDVIDRIADFGLFAATPALRRYRSALARRPSVRAAVAPDYPDRLLAFILRRDRHLAALASGAGIAATARGSAVA